MAPEKCSVTMLSTSGEVEDLESQRQGKSLRTGSTHKTQLASLASPPSQSVPLKHEHWEVLEIDFQVNSFQAYSRK